MNILTLLRGLLVLTLVLALAGCKEGGAKQDGGNAAKPAADEGPSKEDIRAGIGKTLPSAQRGFAGLDLQNIAKLYAVNALTGTPPKGVQDLRDLDARTRHAVEDGTYVVVWNVTGTGGTDPVVAYEKDVPEKGGMVATLNGAVTRMTPQEFKAAKAGGR